MKIKIVKLLYKTKKKRSRRRRHRRHASNNKALLHSGNLAEREENLPALISETSKVFYRFFISFDWVCHSGCEKP